MDNNYEKLLCNTVLRYNVVIKDTSNETKLFFEACKILEARPGMIHFIWRSEREETEYLFSSPTLLYEISKKVNR